MTFCLTPFVLLASSGEHGIDFSERDLIWRLDPGETDRGTGEGGGGRGGSDDIAARDVSNSGRCDCSVLPQGVLEWGGEWKKVSWEEEGGPFSPRWNHFWLLERFVSTELLIVLEDSNCNWFGGEIKISPTCHNTHYASVCSYLHLSPHPNLFNWPH